MSASFSIIKHIKVELYGPPVYYAVSAKQNDKATRYIGVTLMEHGADYILPAGVELRVSISKPDTTKVWNECSRAGNEILVPLTNQTLAAAGSAMCDIEVSTHEASLTSASFELEIFASQRDDSYIESTNEFTVLEIAIQRAKDALADARVALAHTQDVDAAITAAEALRVAAEHLRVGQENARQKNTATAIANSEAATAASIAQTELCRIATEATVDILMAQEALDAAVAAIIDYYNRIAALETDINLNIDGGTATSQETLLIKGGTARSVDRDKYYSGNAYTI